MNIISHRFGDIEVETADIIRFPNGIIGFPDACEFILLRNESPDIMGWLQCVTNPALALPVVSAHCFVEAYPDVAVDTAAEAAGLGDDVNELAILSVLTAPPGQPATINLLAPIVINAETRVGAQLLLEGSRFTTRELFVLPSAAPTPTITHTTQAEATPTA